MAETKVWVERREEIPERDGFSSYIEFAISFLLGFAILASIYFVIHEFFMPTALEYDDPTTSIQETFPWAPNLFSDSGSAMRLLGMGILRHISLLPQNVTPASFVTLLGTIFLILVVYDIKRTFLSRTEITIEKYVRWGIGSVVTAVVYIAASATVARSVELSLAVILFALTALIFYLMLPRSSLLQPKKKDAVQLAALKTALAEMIAKPEKKIEEDDVERLLGLFKEYLEGD